MKRLQQFDKFYVAWENSKTIEPFYITSAISYRGKMNVIANSWDVKPMSTIMGVVKKHIMSAELLKCGIKVGIIYRHRWQYKLCRFLHRINIIN